MLLERYQARVDELLREVRETQRETIIKAGKLIADTVANGGGVFLSGICHSIENDAIYRGGGPIFYKHFSWSLNVEQQGRERPTDGMDASMEGLAAYALKKSRIRPGDVVIETVVAEYLEPLRQAGVDTVILGCTHYPLLLEVIAQIMGPGVELVSAGEESAFQLKRMLKERGLRAPEDRQGQTEFYVSDRVEDFEQTATLFLRQDLRHAARRIDIDQY